MKVPLSGEAASEFLRAVVPDDPRVTTKLMFGNLATFVNGNLFMGVYGDDLFLRLSGKDREDLLKVKRTALFEPMKGRPMKNYVLIPRSWIGQPDLTESWVAKSLKAVSALPSKKNKK